MESEGASETDKFQKMQEVLKHTKENCEMYSYEANFNQENVKYQQFMQLRTLL